MLGGGGYHSPPVILSEGTQRFFPNNGVSQGNGKGKSDGHLHCSVVII